ncbi:hypothetical protein E2C01_065101 [Portunus trituberculatus]|uniref:Uncharacterized protein n=1 Tax=Portunus trituberculatus TaxID=210409 RepID=A0A5B7HM42_PORTR|nr:hypothetical protein [Portunus trituberculatus]
MPGPSVCTSDINKQHRALECLCRKHKHGGCEALEGGADLIPFKAFMTFARCIKAPRHDVVWPFPHSCRCPALSLSRPLNLGCVFSPHSGLMSEFRY